MKKISVILLALVPVVAFAQPTAAATSGLEGLLDSIASLFGKLNVLFISAAVLAFFWGLLVFILQGDDSKKKDKAKGIMLWSIIALFLMVSVWGIVTIMQETLFGDSNVKNISIPSLPSASS